MSDENRKFWKESIGVRGNGRRAATPGATGRVGTLNRPTEATRPERADGRSAARPASKSSESATGPVTGRVGVDLTAEALGRLSVGSSSFAQDVEKHLWTAPTPNDLRALAAIAGERHRIPDDERRRLTVTAVGLRTRVEGLTRALSRPVLDATVLQARAVEWARLTRLAAETRDQLAPREDDERGVDVLEAARALLPAHHRLEAEARLAAEVAATVDAILSGRSKEIMAAATHVPDIEALVTAIQERKLRPGDGLYLEALAAGSLARRVLEESADDVPLSGRVIRQVLGRFDQEVSAATSAHARDPQSKARLAAWLRFMRDMKSRIDETISRPVDVDTGPVVESSGAAPKPLNDPESERIVIQHLREVRKSAVKKGLSTRLPDLPEPPPPEKPEPAAAPAAAEAHAAPGHDADPTEILSRTPRPNPARMPMRIAACGLVLALFLVGASALLPSFDAHPAIKAADFREGMPLLEVRSAGALLIATADPTWDTLPSDERRIAAGRLMSLAEARGFRAGLLTDASGRTLATWSPGREPALR